MPYTVGLTGGIASGKSQAAEIFETAGVPVLDADHVAREVVTPPSAVLDVIAREFGTEFLHSDGTLDRRRLRAHVFGDAAARHRLDHITHPAIRERLTRWRDAQTAPYCVLSVSILVESGMVELVDRVLVIDARETVQVRRLTARDRIDEALARQMLAAQLSREARLARADDVVENNDGVEHLRHSILDLHARYLNLAKTTGPR